MPSTSAPKYAPSATVRPLMHGSTSPSKNADPSYSHVQLSRTSATFSRTTSASRSTPNWRRSSRVGKVDVHWLTLREVTAEVGREARAASPPVVAAQRQQPRAQPSVATRARSASTASDDAPQTSRSTCHRRAGSESSNQSVTFIGCSTVHSLCQSDAVAISGAHVVVFSADPDADRQFFRDVLKYPNVDAGGGWLIFKLPPAETRRPPERVERRARAVPHVRQPG